HSRPGAAGGDHAHRACLLRGGHGDASGGAATRLGPRLRPPPRGDPGCAEPGDRARGTPAAPGRARGGTAARRAGQVHGGRPARARRARSRPGAGTPGRLVGPVGAGKSTVAALLLRFCEPCAGSVTLGGAELASYRADDVRAVIGGCPQDSHIFAGTIRDNLRLARPGCSDEELADAATRACLLTWIRGLPLGWDTPVGAHGTAMSGGERQRLFLARALLADPAVLILDEPTAHVDQETAAALTADLLGLTAGRTTLLITHDMAGLECLDEIVVLDRGKVVQRGTHAQLMRTGGRYRRLRVAAGPSG